MLRIMSFDILGRCKIRFALLRKLRVLGVEPRLTITKIYLCIFYFSCGDVLEKNGVWRSSLVFDYDPGFHFS